MEEEKKEEHKHHEHHEHNGGEHHKKNSHHKINLEIAFVILAAALMLILLVNIFLTFELNQNMKKNAADLTEKLRPAKIQLAVIKNSKCADCFDISSSVSYIKSQKVNVTGEKTLDFASTDAKKLISQYKIEKLPAIIITGEIDKTSIQGLQKKDNALLLQSASPPYTNSTNGNIVGRVILYKIYDQNCEKCNDMGFWINQFKLSGIKIVEQINISADSDKGKELADANKISFAPFIILSKDAGVYDVVQKAWQQIGVKAKDGYYILTLVNPPFINLTTHEVKGIVNIIYLTDKDCAECYNVTVHKQILSSPQTIGVKLDKETTIDIGDAAGKELLAKYNITQVPTVVLSSEASVYPTIRGLSQFFSVEKDGSYVFRKPEVVGAYKDLATNQIVKPRQAQQ